jgi:hypothetical protein
MDQFLDFFWQFGSLLLTKQRHHQLLHFRLAKAVKSQHRLIIVACFCLILRNDKRVQNL